MKKQILFVDDEQRVLDGLRRLLHPQSHEWELSFAHSADEALDQVATTRFDAIVSDVSMPGKDGLWLLRNLQKHEHGKSTPVLMLTGLMERDLKRRALDMGAADLLSKPVEREELVARLRNVLRLKASQDSLSSLNDTLEKKVAERTTELEESRLEVIWRLAKAGEFRDEGTGNHVVRVGYYCRAIAMELGVPPEFVETLFLTSPLHDIGKIGTPDGILLKPGSLTLAERQIMQRHCIIGRDILMSDPSILMPLPERTDQSPRPIRTKTHNRLLETAATIAMTHHERWDGSGYPDGLAGNNIPLEGRIAAIADVYDALCSERIYKPAYPESQAIAIMSQEVGRHFDPDVFAAFERVSSEFRRIRTQLSDPAWQAESEAA